MLGLVKKRIKSAILDRYEREGRTIERLGIKRDTFAVLYSDGSQEQGFLEASMLDKINQISKLYGGDFEAIAAQNLNDGKGGFSFQLSYKTKKGILKSIKGEI